MYNNELNNSFWTKDSHGQKNCIKLSRTNFLIVKWRKAMDAIYRIIIRKKEHTCMLSFEPGKLSVSIA